MAPSGIKVRLVPDSDAKATAQVLPYSGQSYQELKRQCLQKRTLFIDPEFKAGKESLGSPPRGESWPTEVVWKRPKDISHSRLPQFISDGMTRFDVLQNHLGDCWFMAAAASLTLHQELLRKVVPPDQTFDEEDYAGIFHFQFWQYGEWVDVVVDDCLPTVNGELYFGRSSDGNEFWMPLLEKAYAKLCGRGLGIVGPDVSPAAVTGILRGITLKDGGLSVSRLNGSYGAIRGGHMKDAFVDFTGGIGERIDLATPPQDLFKTIQEALSRKSLMAAGILPKGMNYLHGLVEKHAYSVTGIHELRLEDKEVKLIRLRNPYGEREWEGPWSDRSELWLKLDSVQREKLCVNKEDGEFWMQLGDFATYFDVLDICHLSPNAPGEEVAPFSWNSSIHHGSWVKGLSAGGWPTSNPFDTFWMNPQFHVSLPETDEAEKGNQDQEPKSTLLVSLMQKDRHRNNKKPLAIRFDIYKVPEMYLQQKSIDQRRKLLQNPKKVSHFEEWTREIAKWFRLPPGNYVIIPSAFGQQEETVNFAIRIFTKKRHQFSEIDGEISAEEKALQVTRPLMNRPNWILYKIFMEEAGEDQQVGTAELQRILNGKIDTMHLKPDGFSLEACRKIIQHFSVQGTGKLTLGEFKQLWAKIIEWEGIFTQYDLYWCGRMNISMIWMTLEAAGFSLNNKTIEVLVKKYCRSCLCIDFDDFVCFMVHLESVFQRCKRRDIEGDGVVYMTEKEWMELATSA